MVHRRVLQCGLCRNKEKYLKPGLKCVNRWSSSTVQRKHYTCSSYRESFCWERRFYLRPCRCRTPNQHHRCWCQQPATVRDPTPDYVASTPRTASAAAVTVAMTTVTTELAQRRPPPRLIPSGSGVRFRIRNSRLIYSRTPTLHQLWTL